MNPLHTLKSDSDQIRWAVLIDAENTSAMSIDAILKEIASLGLIVVKRVYGDFSHPSLVSWKSKAQDHGLAPVHCFRSVTGKSNSDMALAIDAMDWLHSGQIDGICLVTSDSDFAPLALRIKEGGRLAYGFGRQITPKSFVNAVHRFVYVETLVEDGGVVTPGLAVSTANGTPPAPDEAAQRSNQAVTIMSMKDAQSAMRAAINDLAQMTGWANLAAVGNLMIKRFPDFSPLNYGVKKLTTFVERLPGVEIRREGEATVVVRMRPSDAAPSA